MTAKILVKEIMDKTGYTLTKIVEELNTINGTPTTIQNLSNKLNRGTIKYSEVETILNIMGHSIAPVPIDLNMFFITHSANFMFDEDLAKKVIQFVNNPSMPYKAKLQIRNFMAHSGRDDISKVVNDFINYTIQEFSNLDQYF